MGLELTRTLSEYTLKHGSDVSVLQHWSLVLTVLMQQNIMNHHVQECAAVRNYFDMLSVLIPHGSNKLQQLSTTYNSIERSFQLMRHHSQKLSMYVFSWDPQLPV